MTGYFFFGSKSNGFHRLPHRVVTPSAAFTQNVSGSFHPVFSRAVRSVFSRSITRPPFSSSTYDIGGLSTREQVVTTNRRDGDRYDWWLAPRQCSSWCVKHVSLGSSSVRSVPSKRTRYMWS